MLKIAENRPPATGDQEWPLVSPAATIIFIMAGGRAVRGVVSLGFVLLSH